MWVLDTDVVKYRFLSNKKRGSRDSSVRTNIQPPDADGRKDEWLTEAGLQFGSEKRHGYLMGVNG